MLYTPGPGSPWNGGLFVLTPSRAVLDAMAAALRGADYDDVRGWHGRGAGACDCRTATCRAVAKRGARHCHGMEGPQGFLYYFFVQRPSREPLLPAPARRRPRRAPRVSATRPRAPRPLARRSRRRGARAS